MDDRATAPAPAFRHPAPFRSDVEGLRGVAILLVVGCHCGIAWCAGGFIGVDVFFVISGYLITGLLARGISARPRGSTLRAFFARRARDFYPPAFSCSHRPHSRLRYCSVRRRASSTARATLAGSIYLSNVFFDHRGSDYFAAQLSEESAAACLVAWCRGAVLSRVALSDLIALRWRRASPAWMLGVLAASSFACGVFADPRSSRPSLFMSCRREHGSLPPVAFWRWRRWQGLARDQELGGRRRHDRCSDDPRNGGVGLNGGAGFPRLDRGSPRRRDAAHTVRGDVTPQWSERGARHGTPAISRRRSYSWYLWHWPFIVFAAISAACDHGRAEDRGSARIALLIADMTYRWIEQPIRSNRYLGAGPDFAGAALPALALLIVGASEALASFAQNKAAVDRKYYAIRGRFTVDFGFASGECYTEGRHFEAKRCEFGDSATPRTVVFFLAIRMRCNG